MTGEQQARSASQSEDLWQLEYGPCRTSIRANPMLNAAAGEEIRPAADGRRSAGENAHGTLDAETLKIETLKMKIKKERREVLISAFQYFSFYFQASSPA